MTVQELIDKIEELESTQEDRDKIVEIIEKKEKTVMTIVSRIKKELDKMPYSTGRNKKKERLVTLRQELLGLQDFMKEMRERLVKPDVLTTDIVRDVKRLGRDFSKIVLKSARTILSDYDIGDYKDIFSSAEKVFDGLSKIPFMATIAGLAKDLSSFLDKGAKGVSWLVNKMKGGEKPAAALDDLVDKVAQMPDAKTRTAPFMNLFNIDDEYQAMLDDALEVEFIQHFKKGLKDFPIKTMTIGELEQQGDNEFNIDKVLQDWLPGRADTKDHTVRTT